MKENVYNGKIEIIKDKGDCAILQIETLNNGLIALIDELKDDTLFEYYDGSGIYILKEVKVIPKDENYVINRFYFQEYHPKDEDITEIFTSTIQPSI